MMREQKRGDDARRRDQIEDSDNRQDRVKGGNNRQDQDQAKSGDALCGKVYLVGAGPGDPGLLTIRGHEILASCQAIVYDRLAATALPADLPEDVELHYVGKRSAHHTLQQHEINALLVRLASEGKTVCRLKGGDPFVFGRGAEEAEALRTEGLPFEVVPGITAGIGAAAYAGIPVTQRGEAVRVTLVTAHEDPDKQNGQVDWRLIGADPHQTVAAYMPVSNLEAVTRELMAGGLDPRTPAALIERGTLPSQRTIASCLQDLAAKVAAAAVRPPALLLVGRTVALHEHLAWLPEGPLSGKRVIVTRPADQAPKMIAALRRLGIEPLICPSIKTVAASESELVPLMADLGGYDWVLFTSENGVRYFFTMLRKLGKDVRALGPARIAAVGSGTAQRLAYYHLQADFVPTTFRGENLLQEFLAGRAVSGLRALRIRGDRAPTQLEDGMRQAGMIVDTVVAYHIRPAEIRPDIQDDIVAEGADAVTFTSGSSVEEFAAFALPRDLRAQALAVCIGPVTAEAASKAGWHRIVTAKVSTIDGLVETLSEALEAGGR
jgi:uroporphyrinogen III methyltransferase/synthase